jgi:hypothetical protein
MTVAILIKFLLLLTLLNTNVHGKVSKLMHCLGQEELNYHKNKLHGPNYRLNQSIINLFTSTQNIELNQNLYTEICKTNNSSPSFGILKNTMLYGVDILKFQNSTGPEAELQKYFMGEFKEKIIEIFFDYLSNIQKNTKKINCLNSQVPELKQLTNSYFYLGHIIDQKDFLKNKKAFKKIFSKLSNIDKVLINCN